MGLANIAATNMEHLCNCHEHGYSQQERWGDASRGQCKVTCECHTSVFNKGDRDCSSAICDAWQEAVIGTPYEGMLTGATYTGNMREVFVESGLFEWKPMSFIAQRGDIYLNEANHTAMCVCANPDNLAEFSISETGGTTGQSGDQTGNESRVRGYYDYPWDGILHYNGKGDGKETSVSWQIHKLNGDWVTIDGDIDCVRCNGHDIRVKSEGESKFWPWMSEEKTDDYAGDYGKRLVGLEVK